MPAIDPEHLFAEYRALRDNPGATRDEYDALAKKVRAAKAAWKKLGDRARAQQCDDVRTYLIKHRPVNAEIGLTPGGLTKEIENLRRLMKTDSPTVLENSVRALWHRLNETRAMLESSPNHDSDHDEFVDGEEELAVLASTLGIDLERD